MNLIYGPSGKDVDARRFKYDETQKTWLIWDLTVANWRPLEDLAQLFTLPDGRLLSQVTSLEGLS